MKTARASGDAARELPLRGVRRLLYRKASAALSFVFQYDHFYLIVCEQLTQRRVRRLPPEMSLTVSDYSDEKLEAIANDLPLDLDIIRFQLGQAGRSNPTIVRIDEGGRTIAAAFLVDTGELVSPSGYRFRLAPGKRATWLCGTFIGEPYRIRGYFANLAEAAFAHAVSNGTIGLAGEVHYSNPSSLKAHLGMGFTIFKHIRYIRLLGKASYWEGPPAL